MRQFGLIGKTLSHSFSKDYFEKKFSGLGLKDCSYNNFELQHIDDLKKILSEHPELEGLNVTFPYKESVIPFMREISQEAREIGAVNCIAIRNKELRGYNTDVYGFEQSVKPFLDPNHEKALILGTGGASKAVAFVLRKKKIPYYFVTSGQKTAENQFQYQEINEIIINSFKLIINCTPLGTFPHVETYPPLPYQYLTDKHLVFDLVYNPSETMLLRKAAEKGAITVNGLSMLQLQAEKSWEIWNS